MKTARKMYEKRVLVYTRFLDRQKRVDGILSNLRLLVFTAGIAAALLIYFSGYNVFYIAALVALITFFAYLVIYQEKLNRRMKYTALLIEINNNSLKRLEGQWKSFEDTGEEFVDENHSYSNDLDIFGKNSLFQWISTARTYVGRDSLKVLLADEPAEINEICERQEAIWELAGKLNWRQRFHAEGMVAAQSMRDPKELLAWGKENNSSFRKPWVIALLRICPIVTILLVTAGFFMDIIPRYIPSTALLIQFGIISYNAKARYMMFNRLEDYNKDLRVYYKMLKRIELFDFKSALIARIKEDVRNNKGAEAYKQLDKLSSIVDTISNRRNAFYIIFNTLTLWDFQSMIALERWRHESGSHLEKWFKAIGRLEALASLSIIGFDNPNWAMPVLDNTAGPLIEAKAIAHPLIIGSRVHNDLTFNEEAKVLLITGSNMSGKSTFLRTAGINLVLAFAGAPVCAVNFRASLMNICTCMRVKDNLEESISSFYAELLRIKTIVAAAESGKNTFFLLDEIFKGTNSQDRHTGAKVLINKLSQTSSVGMVSTHDLELCELEQENKMIANSHFQEYYEDGSIHFDYKLLPGPSSTRNALHLMRLIGIEV